MIDNLLLNLANSKLFTGCIMLISNIGGKYLSLDIPSNMDKLFSNYFILRCIVLFSIFFMATRDIKISVLLSLLFFIVTNFFINEKSTFCLLVNNEIKIEKNNKISEEEFKRAKEIINKYYQDSEKKLRNNY
jgi:hypothetical protein